MHTVGLLAHNGHLGGSILPHLISAHHSGLINLIILHRASSDLTTVPADIEKREITLDEAHIDSIKSAVAGINIVISPVASAAVFSQLPLVEALAGSKDLVTLIPSEFGNEWTEEDLSNPNLAFMAGTNKVSHRARELGVPITIMRNGLVPEMIYSVPDFGMQLKANKVKVFRKSRTTKAPFSGFPFIGAATAQLVITRPDTIANKTFYAIEFEASGADFIQAFEKVNGTVPEVTELSEETWAEQMDAGFMSSLLAATWRMWGDGAYVWHGEKIGVDGWQVRGLDVVAKGFLH